MCQQGGLTKIQLRQIDKEGWQREAPQCGHMRGNPPLCRQGWPAGTGYTLSSGFNRKTQFSILAMPTNLVLERNLSLKSPECGKQL